jgi:hypothetical protein
VVVDSRPPYAPLSGVTVSANPLAGFCPPAGCNPVETDPTGAFKVVAAPGENVVLLSDPYYMTNRTWAYVNTNGITDTGTTELVHDGYVTGTVRADDAAHEPLGGILIAAQTRDGTFQAVPEAHTDASGQFTVAVPPVPSELTFSSLFAYTPYEANYTWTNVSAGMTLNIGTVYLETSTVVSVNIIDSTTLLPITGPASIQVTSKATQYAPPQGAVMGGPQVEAWAPVGPDSAVIYAAGYVIDPVSLGVVPPSSPGSSPVFMGTFDLVPLGGIAADFGIVGGMNTMAAQKWGIGTAVVSSCSLDLVQTAALTPSNNFTATTCTGGCDANIGQYVEFAALPLRNYITVAPDTSGVCGFGGPTWPIPGMLPVFENWGWANVTPNYLTVAGEIDLLPGTYVQGEVLPASQVAWDVNACSTDEPSLCGEGVYSDQSYSNDYANYVANGCVAPGESGAAVTFCVPVPPGPDKITVGSNNASSNYTWVQWNLDDYSQLPMPMASASLGHVQSINLTTGLITGRVLQARSLTPVLGLPVVQACPAGTAPGAVSCLSGVANVTGYFALPAPLGWDRVTVSATDYVANATWLFVRASNTTGTILLTPYGYIGGQVVNAQGAGIYEATITLCHAVSPTGCPPLGADGGATSTDGQYFGAAPAGALPLGAYEVKATAPGYQTDWTWVNLTTPGENFTAPTIVLRALPVTNASGTVAGRSSTAAADPPVGSWVSGRVIDAANGIGLPDAAISVQSILGGSPTSINAVRGTGGEFNDSLPVGEYVVTVTLPSFSPHTVFLNVTGNNTTVAVGTIALIPLPTITGQLVIDPWRNAVTYGMGLGPGQATVTVCSSVDVNCGPGVTVESSGAFNVSAPVGLYDIIYATGAGGGTGSSPAGFVANQTSVNVTGQGAARGPPVVIGLPIFGTIVGSVVENGTAGATPVRYDAIVAAQNNPTYATLEETLTATGTYAMFFPPARILNMTAGGQGAWIPEGTWFSVDGNLSATQPLVLTTGAVVDLDALAGGPSFSLVHFGWLDARVVNAGTNTPVPYATLSAGEPGFLWGSPVGFSASGVADGGGFLNVSVPPSIPASQPLSIFISSPDYSSVTTTATVGPSRTTFLNGTDIANLHGFGLMAWGWVTGNVSDSATGAPLQGAVPVVTDPNGTTGATDTQTNGRGHFFVDAPPSSSDRLSMKLAGFGSNTSFPKVGYGQLVTVAPIALVGDGIVQGVVTSFPGAGPVAGATVTLCPRSQSNCVDRVTTNASGIFAVAGPPGLDVLLVTADGYVSNVPVYVKVVSDTWTWVGDITIDEYAYVTGVALGLPGGGPVAGANASLCALPVGGEEVGPCFATVSTGPDGTFLIEAPAGSYILDLNATFYNDTYLAVSVVPGETLPVGTLFLDEYGTVVGTVLAAGTGSPLVGARVIACEAWGADTCLPATTTGPTGGFVISGPAGPYTFQASAAGYLSAYARSVLPSGVTVRLANFSLLPIGPGNRYPVSGSVVTAATDLPIAGAVVAATGGFLATTGPSGTFSLVLPWGTTTVTAALPGYFSSTKSLMVDGPVTGLNFTLAIATYSVQGTVRDGLTGAAVGNVTFQTSGGAPLGSVSAGNGTFSFELPNGTYDLLAQPSPASSYGTVPFTVTVNGAPARVNLSLYPVTVTLDGLVTNALTGELVAGASVTVSGTTIAGVPWQTTVASGPDGRFVVRAYSGNCMVSAQAAGYLPTTQMLSVPAPTPGESLPLAVHLDPTSTTGAASGLSATTMLWVAVGVGGAACVGGLLWHLSRRPARPRRPSRSAPTSPRSEGK